MRVIHILPTLQNGGTERYLMNLLTTSRYFSSNSIIVYSQENFFRDELKNLDVPVVPFAKPSETGILKNMRSIYYYLKKEKPDAIYVYTYFNAAYVNIAALFAGVRRRIVHVHTASTDHKKTLSYKLYVVLSKILLTIIPCIRLACSNSAGKTLFWRKFAVIKNATDINKYRFNLGKRNSLRNKMSIDNDTIVLGNVGRLDENKNQKFILEICKNIHKKGFNYKLLLLGEGSEKSSLQRYATELGIAEDVIFITTEDAAQYYNAFDIFLLTSKSEGYPYVLLEAQANGLPIVVSTGVTEETKINDNFRRLSLDEGADKWAQVVCEMVGKRVKPNEKINDYSIEKMAEEVRGIYEK